MHLKRGTKFALAAFSWLALWGGAHNALAASTGLSYYGGPVAHSMNVVLVEWGSAVRSTYTDTTTGDPAFFTYLAAQSGSTDDIGGVLAQYMDTSGINSENRFSYGGVMQITPPTSGSGARGCSLPSCVSDSQIQSTLQSDIGSGAVPTPAGSGLSTIYVVLFPPNVNVCDGSTCAYSSNGFCAYHGSFPLTSSTHVLYAAMVDNGPGTPNFGLCGPSSSTDIGNQTDVLSHEFSETINDPLVAESGNTFGPPLAWYNPTLGEIGDICATNTAAEQALNGPWTVQKIWSNLDGNCVAGEPAYTAPTARFLANSTATAGQEVSFDASASTDPPGDAASASYSGFSYSISSGIVSYQWNWGDGSTTGPSASPSANHAYADGGDYQVSLTVTNRLGFTSTVTQPLSIASPPPVVRTPAPSVTTGSPSNLTSSRATVSGTVNPDGVASTYQVQFGASSAYGYSSPAFSAGSGGSDVPVTITLSGLNARTTYHYRLVASSAGGTVVGVDRTFTTAPALAGAPRFAFRAIGRPAPPRAVRAGLKLRFTCSKACFAHFNVIVVPKGGLRPGVVPVSVAAGSGRLRARGSGTAILSFSPSVRARLRRASVLKLRISGLATGRGTATSAPVQHELTLGRRG